MWRTNKGYSSFRLKELDGGLNLKNSPNEIENKQATKCVNFNFDWNKLVNSDYINKYSITNPFPSSSIEWLNIIDQRLYVIYNNTVTSKVDIMQWINWIWRNALDNLNSYFFYIPDNETIWADAYSIRLVWVDFVFDTIYYHNSSPWDTRLDIYQWFANKIAVWVWWTYFPTEIWEVLINWIPTIWLFIWCFGKNRFTATEEGKWILINSFIPNTATDWELFKSWDDLILCSSNNFPIYYKSFWNSYFWQEIRWVPIWSYWVYYNWKLILSDYKTNILYFSKTSSATQPFLVSEFWWYDAWAQRVWWDWRITWIITWESWIYVFKEDEIYYSNSVQDDWIWFAFVLNRITNNWAENYKLITRWWQEIFYYDWINSKVRRLSYEQNLTTLRDTWVSSDVDLLIKWVKDYNKILYYSYPNLFLSTENNWTIYYNVDNKSWWEEQISTILANWKYILHNDDIYERVNNIVFTSWEWQSKEFDLWDGIDYKRFWEVEIYWKNNSWIDLFLDVYVDWELKETRTITNNFESSFFKRKYDLWYEWRYIKIWIRYSWQWKIEINEINFQYKPIKSYHLYN